MGITTPVETFISLRYAAAEILRDEKPTMKTDVYSFACVALEISTNKCPFFAVPNTGAVVNLTLGGVSQRHQIIRSCRLAIRSGTCLVDVGLAILRSARLWRRPYKRWTLAFMRALAPQIFPYFPSHISQKQKRVPRSYDTREFHLKTRRGSKWDMNIKKGVRTQKPHIPPARWAILRIWAGVGGGGILRGEWAQMFDYLRPEANG